jgi:hypothetical protein
MQQQQQHTAPGAGARRRSSSCLSISPLTQPLSDISSVLGCLHVGGAESALDYQELRTKRITVSAMHHQCVHATIKRLTQPESRAHVHAAHMPQCHITTCPVHTLLSTWAIRQCTLTYI